MAFKISEVPDLIRKVIAPPFCGYCREYIKEYEPLCKRCAQLIKPVISTYISLRTTRMQVYAAAAYEDPLKTLILAKSWSDYTAATKLGELLYHYSPIQSLSFDYIVPIPLHYWRLAYRGFNQVDVMAQVLSKSTFKPVLQALERVRHSPFQSLFPRSRRFGNVEGSFALKPELELFIEGKRILLLDDVMTTGSTLYEAGKILCAASPANLEALVVCRAP